MGGCLGLRFRGRGRAFKLVRGLLECFGQTGRVFPGLLAAFALVPRGGDVLGQPTTAFLVERFVVDGLVNLAGLAGKVAAFFTGIVDNWIVDGAVNGVAFGTAALGDRLSYAATGRIRNYLLYIVLGVVGLSVILVIVI